MIKGIIFDFGGVLMRTEDHSPRRAWDERLGLSPGSVERAVHNSDIWVQAQLGRIAPKQYWQGVAELLYMRQDTLDDDLQQLRRDYFSGDRLNYGLVELIHDLRGAGRGVVLLSNDSVELEGKLRNLGIYDAFDQVHISAQIGVMKPDRTAYRVALTSLGTQPHETVFIDDSIPNIMGARNLGIHTIMFRAGMDLRGELHKLFDKTAE